MDSFWKICYIPLRQLVFEIKALKHFSSQNYDQSVNAAWVLISFFDFFSGMSRIPWWYAVQIRASYFLNKFLLCLPIHTSTKMRLALFGVLELFQSLYPFIQSHLLVPRKDWTLILIILCETFLHFKF